VENHQGTREVVGADGEKKVERGVHIPEVLRPYMAGVTFLPFVREPRDFGGQQKPAKAEARKKGEAMQKEKKAQAAVAEKDTEEVAAPKSPPKGSPKKSPKKATPVKETIAEETLKETAAPRRRGSTYSVAGDEYETFIVELAGKTFDSVQAYVAFLNSKSNKQ
jgi:hypothetical protein